MTVDHSDDLSCIQPLEPSMLNHAPLNFFKIHPSKYTNNTHRIQNKTLYMLAIFYKFWYFVMQKLIWRIEITKMYISYMFGKNIGPTSSIKCLNWNLKVVIAYWLYPVIYERSDAMWVILVWLFMTALILKWMSFFSNYSWDEAENTCLEKGMSLPLTKTIEALSDLSSLSANHDCGLLTFLGMKRNSQVVTISYYHDYVSWLCLWLNIPVYMYDRPRVLGYIWVKAGTNL